MADQKSESIIPWPAVVALVAMIGGAYWYLDPLTSSRPRVDPRQSSQSLNAQDVDSRLWQDPVATTETAYRATTQPSGDHSIEVLLEEMSRKSKKDSKTLVMPVMVPGGPHADQVERRLRSRYAVLGGLSVSGYVPADSNHIRYVTMKWRRPYAVESDITPLVIPYEWCEAQYNNAALAFPGTYDSVLLLWLRDDAFLDKPLARLASILGEIRPRAVKGKNNPVDFAIIAPYSSTTLRTMLYEAAYDEDLAALDFRNAKMYAATPTAPGDLLVHNLSGVKINGQLPTVDLLMRYAMGKDRFFRTINTDDDICEAMVEELDRREVKVGSAKDHVAIISEWDTFYGRALPVTFAKKATQRSYSDLLLGLPPSIHWYSYLRGLDGRLPAEPEADKSDHKSDERKTLRPMEEPAGLHQADYLRRLAIQLEDLNWELVRSNRGRLRAIGILGSDVYDKLLIMKALRKHFPSVIFFTNDLDARMGHPDEWNETHNLVVASAFGLSLHPSHQVNIAPFRDGYQTAMFAATLMATSKLSPHAELKPVRLFEIGRGGPRDLSLDRNRGGDETTASESKVGFAGTRSSVDAANPGVAPPRLPASGSTHPARLDSGSWLSAKRAAQVTVAAGLAVFLIIWLMWLSGLLKIFRWKRFFSTTTAVLLMATPVIFGLMWAVHALEGAGGEPFALFDGISIWPTETIRLIAAVLCAHYVFKAYMDLKDNDEKIKEEFALECSKSSCSWKSPGMSDWNIRVAGDSLLVDGEKLWDEYTAHGFWTPRLIRFVVPAGAYLLFGLIIILNLFPPPIVPARGWISYKADAIILSIGVIASIFLTFYVIDATRLNQKFIQYLAEGKTRYPDKTLEIWKTKRPGIDSEDLSELLDVALIGTRTAVVGQLIYYPFLILFLMIISRVSYFDNWQWPISLIIVFSLNSLLALSCALGLQWDAEKARRKAIANLSDKLFGYETLGAENQASALKHMISEIEASESGSFGRFSKHPVLRAILLPSSGIAVVAIVEFLMKTW